ncbi:hypothetical protein POM88_046091 [Heracleum sosnowskyi]|uniref:RING-type E3 ubiquitin transferase n=1 Tax=Heracleum sosnowskyi TaxID=360622 RepID=A0AAD8H8P0_9APIA|nr:hypothetical protein POM88_046091 [Heracleum sosnowskyi]
MGKSILLHLSYWKLVVIVLMLFTTVLDAVVDKICSVSRCSDGGPDIHFPFWLQRNNSGDQPDDDCSHPPGFQLSCTTLYETILELQHLVNTSIKGLQLSLMYNASVRFIDYQHHRLHIDHTPYLTDIIPAAVPVNSSSTSKHSSFHKFQMHAPDFSYGFNYPYRPFKDFPLTCDTSSGSCELIQEITFFNCSSSQTSVKNYGTEAFISSLSTRDYKVYAFSSHEDTFYMMEYIKSCTKMYDTSTKMPPPLSWQTPVSRGRCEHVRERCKFDDIDRYPGSSISNPAYFEPPPAGSGLATTKRLVAVILPCIFLVGLGFIFLYNFIQSRVDKQKKEASATRAKSIFSERLQVISEAE